MARKRYRHIFLPSPTRTFGFTNPRRGGGGPRVRERDRKKHGRHLLRSLEKAWEDNESRTAVAHVEREGSYIEFLSEPGFELAFESLEARSAGIRLLNVRQVVKKKQVQTFATVFVPHAQRGRFLKRLKAYADPNLPSGKRDYKNLMNGIANIRAAVIESFWQSDPKRIPGAEARPVEIWLRDIGEDSHDDFNKSLTKIGIDATKGVLKFPERTIRLITANRQQLERLIDSCDDIAEIRDAPALASFYIHLENRDQVKLVTGILERCRFDPDSNVSVCILDRGINNGHNLLKPVLADDDKHAVISTWGVNDHDRSGHGTLMAGTAAYGDILALLSDNGLINVTHILESSKIEPPPPAANPRELWGLRTAQGISLAEIEAPDRKRIICMAVTASDDRRRGRPSSWSAEVDQLSSGGDGGNRRLFVLSAGNVCDSDSFRNYHSANLTDEIHDPGQAWNALTVGAFTEKITVSESGFKPIAPSGGLSPYSTTSSTWAKWPVKPEIVLEGGNVARGRNDSIFETEELKLLSTSHEPLREQFAPFFATSAASAQAAWMAARIQTIYPDAWPETIRGLLVHTADWTATMKSQMRLPTSPSKADYGRLLRVFGYGVPSLERALYCSENSLTLISEAELQPYDKLEKERNGKLEKRYGTRDMHLYNLPWPFEVLSEMAAVKVRMRITLSYFIEPGPGEVGWDDRYRYPSHLLRFALNGTGELEQDFIQRVNAQARDDGQHPGTDGPEDAWVIGETNRNLGSIHSDIWEGTAADLATSNLIAIYPAAGWWKQRYYLEQWNKKARYSLIVSIQTPPSEIDIYTPVATKVRVRIPVPIPATPRRRPSR